GFDEGDAFDAVLDRRIDHVLGRLAALAARRADRPRRLLVEVGEAFQIALGMAAGDASQARRGRPRARAGPGQEPLRLAERCVPEIVRVGLDPFEPAFGAVYPQLQ